MPRTTKAPGGGKRHPLNMRTTKETRERLEASASANGRSLAQEVEVLLNHALTHQAALGGPEMQRLAYHMVAAFALPAQRSAGDKQNWVNDQGGYRAGVIGVCDALFQGLSDEDAALAIEALKGRLLTRIAQAKEDSK